MLSRRSAKPVIRLLCRRFLRRRLGEVMTKYSFTPDEWAELERNGLDPNPTKRGDASFDEAVSEVYHRMVRRGEEASGEGEALRASS